MNQERVAFKKPCEVPLFPRVAEPDGSHSNLSLGCKDLKVVGEGEKMARPSLTHCC